MKSILVFAILLIFSSVAFSQNEQAAILEKEFKYKNWNYKNIQDDKSIDLRDFATGKKLVLVIYFAPWCHNWKHEAPFAQKLYEKYKDQGLAIIGVGEYDTVDAMKSGIEELKIGFPIVYESDSKDLREKTTHYDYRKEIGDTRKWGSPWNILLIPSELKKKGDTLTKKAYVSSGELIEKDAEKFIRIKLGLPAEESTAAIKEKPIEVCDEASTTQFKKP